MERNGDFSLFCRVRSSCISVGQEKPDCLFAARKITKTIFEGMDVLGWEGKGGRGGLVFCFFVFLVPLWFRRIF